MVFKWNEQNTLLFLDNFKNYQCLWNHKIDTYKDKIQRAKAMKSLIQDLNISELTEEDIKRKIKTIRTRYATELSRIRHSTKSGCSSEELYVPCLYWFKHAEFLSNVCVPRQSASNINIRTKTEQLSEVSQNEESSEADQELDESQSKNYVKVENKNFENMGDDHKTKNSNKGPQIAFPGTTSKRKRLNETPIDKIYLKRTNKQNNIEQEQEEDEFDLFCRSLAVQLKKMPLDRALICQEQLQSVMVQERLSQLCSTSMHQQLPRPEYVYSERSTPSPGPASLEYIHQSP